MISGTSIGSNTVFMLEFKGRWQQMTYRRVLNRDIKTEKDTTYINIRNEIPNNIFFWSLLSFFRLFLVLNDTFNFINLYFN